MEKSFDTTGSSVEIANQEKAKSFVSWLTTLGYLDKGDLDRGGENIGDQSYGLVAKLLASGEAAHPIVMNRLHRVKSEHITEAVERLIDFLPTHSVLVFTPDYHMNDSPSQDKKKHETTTKRFENQREMGLLSTDLVRMRDEGRVDEISEKIQGWRIARVEQITQSEYWLGAGLEERGKIEGIFPEELEDMADVLATHGMLLLVVGGVTRRQLGVTPVKEGENGGHDVDAIVVGAQNIGEVMALIQNMEEVELVDDQSNRDKYQQVRLKVWDRSADISLARRERHTADGVEIVVAADRGERITAAVDLKRRGFRVDAMFVNSDGYVYAWPGAYRDLEYKVLTMIDPEAFIQDPRRLVRGIGYVMQGFRFNKDNVAVLRGMVDTGALSEYVGTHGAKIGKVMKQLAESPDPFKALLQLDRIGVVGKYVSGDIGNRLDWSKVEGLRVRNSISDEFTISGTEMKQTATRLEQSSESVLRFVVAHMVDTSSSRSWLLNDSGWKLPNEWDRFAMDTFVQRNRQQWKKDVRTQPRRWQDWVELMVEYQDLCKQMPRFDGSEVDRKTLYQGGLVQLKRKAWLTLLGAK